MPKIDYIDTLQACLCVMVIVALGYLFGGLKVFGITEAFSMRRTIYLICLPGLLFREIALHKLNLHDWQPFFNGLLTQATIHIVYVLISFIGPFKDKLKTFLSFLYSTSYINIIFFGYPIVQVLYGNDYVYIPAMHNLVQLFFCIPIHTVLSLYITKDPPPDEHDGHHEEDMLEEGIQRENDGPIHPVETNQSASATSQQDEGTTTQDQVEQVTANEDSDESVEEPYYDSDSSQTQNDDHKKKKKSCFTPRQWAIFWSIVTPSNICSILGIIWSATGWTMPAFLHDFVYDIEKATMAAGLFTCGIFMWEHPFFGCNAWKLTLALFVHFIIIPLISMFWGWVCKVDETTGTINVLLHAMPVALVGYAMSLQTGQAMKIASFSFFWSILLSLPLTMLWVLVFNKLDIFSIFSN